MNDEKPAHKRSVPIPPVGADMYLVQDAKVVS